MKKCKVCKKSIKQSGPGRPRLTHARCKGASSSTSKKKSSKVRRYSSGSKTRSQRGRAFAGSGTGWVYFWHGGRTGDTQHDKTWAVKVAKKGKGWTVVTRHGRRTGQKNETERGVMSKDKALATRASLIRQKLNKGYLPVGAKRGY